MEVRTKKMTTRKMSEGDGVKTVEQTSLTYTQTRPTNEKGQPTKPNNPNNPM